MDDWKSAGFWERKEVKGEATSLVERLKGLISPKGLGAKSKDN